MLKTPYFAYNMGNEGGRDALLTQRFHLVYNIINAKSRTDTSCPKTFKNKPVGMRKRSIYLGLLLLFSFLIHPSE